MHRTCPVCTGRATMLFFRWRTRADTVVSGVRRTCVCLVMHQTLAPHHSTREVCKWDLVAQHSPEVSCVHWTGGPDVLYSKWLVFKLASGASLDLFGAKTRTAPDTSGAHVLVSGEATASSLAWIPLHLMQETSLGILKLHIHPFVLKRKVWPIGVIWIC